MTTIIGTGEVGALHSREELEEMQRLPLQRKIQITTARIIEWYQHYDGKVYVAFSGGKDSTVLLDIVRRIYPMERLCGATERRQSSTAKNGVICWMPHSRFLLGAVLS